LRKLPSPCSDALPRSIHPAKQNKVYDRRSVEFSFVRGFIVPAAAASAAKIRRALRRWLRRISSFAGLYAVVASLGLVVLVVGAIGLHGLYTTKRQVQGLEDVGRRAFFAEHANSLIYAVVMDSRGVYMSAEAADRARFGAGIMKFLAELDANMAAWNEHIVPEDREEFARAQARTEEFIRFRTELVRLGNEVGQAAARDWGDNEINRANREALNRAIDALANSNYAELAKLRASINAYSARQFALATTAMAGGILLVVLLILLMVRRQRRDAATQIAAKEAYLAEAQRLSHTGSFGWSTSGGFVWSDETFRIFGLDQATKPTLDAVMQQTHPEDVARVQEFIDHAFHAGADADLEHRIVMPDGSVKHLHVVAHPVRDEAGDLAFVGAVMDVTAAKRADEAQAELAHVARMATVGELTAWIGHEVNQPLAAIVTNGGACLRWLAQGTLDEARSSVGSMIRDAQRASEIIRSIRALAKKSEPEKAPLRINDVIGDVVRLVHREVLRHGASLRLELAPTLPPVLGDRVQLQQVIINLVLNALQAMASVTDRRRVVLIRSQRRDDGRVVVAVADTGVGIEAKSMDKLFNAFFTTKPSGMGMGLSICRSIIEAHGGQISAANNPGPGATFQFTLPSGEARL
jgi:PAS domain S-box-containing protein